MPQEAEQCDVTGKFVRKGVLEACALTRKPSCLLSSSAAPSATEGTQTMLVTSSVSEARLQHRLGASPRRLPIWRAFGDGTNAAPGANSKAGARRLIPKAS